MALDTLRPNQAMQRTAGRSAFYLSMTYVRVTGTFHYRPENSSLYGSPEEWEHQYTDKHLLPDGVFSRHIWVDPGWRRTAGLVGVNLMRKAFKPASPILKFSDVAAEQEAAMNLFCGFIGFFKNPHSHKFLNVTDPLTAFEIISMANHLYTLIDKANKA